jgi:hypothetical protein
MILDVQQNCVREHNIVKDIQGQYDLIKKSLCYDCNIYVRIYVGIYTFCNVHFKKIYRTISNRKKFIIKIHFFQIHY